MECHSVVNEKYKYQFLKNTVMIIKMRTTPALFNNTFAQQFCKNIYRIKKKYALCLSRLNIKVLFLIRT